MRRKLQNWSKYLGLSRYLNIYVLKNKSKGYNYASKKIYKKKFVVR